MTLPQLSRYLPVLLAMVLMPVIATAQWREVYKGGNGFFNEVFFIDATTGWVTEMGPSVLRTADGGTTWSTSTLPNATGSANRDICFVSRSVGYVSGGDGLWGTSDGGATWRQITVPGRRGGQSSIWFIDAQTGIFSEGNSATGIASFYRTSDAGITWSVTHDTSTVLDAAIGGMTYANGRFYASGGGGNLWSSSDNGVTWQRLNTGSQGWQEDLISYASKLYIASANGTSYGSTGGGKVLFNTTDDATWALREFPSTVMWGVTMYTPTGGWACGETGKAYQTTDGWTTWSDRSCGIDPIAHLDDIWFADQSSGWAVGQTRAKNGSSYAVVYKFVSAYARVVPDTILFGDVLVGSTSPDRIAKIQSVGSGLTLTRAIGGEHTFQFVAPGGLGTPQTPGYCGEAETILFFRPTSIGEKRAYLEYTYANGDPGPRVVLIGNGVKPDLNAPALHRFDTLRCRRDLLDTISISNTGSYPLIVSTATMQTPENGTFELVSPSLPATVQIGRSEQFVIRARADAPGIVQGTMLFGSNDVDRSPWTISLHAFYHHVAVGFDRDTLLTISPAPIYERVSACIDYINTGNGGQVIESVLPSGNGSQGFEQSPPILRRLLDPAASLPICFQVTPSDTGWQQQRFRVRTSPCARDTFVTVRVYGTNPSITSVREKMFSDICGVLSSDTIEIHNRGNVPLVVQQPTIAGAAASNFALQSPTIWPVTILPGSMAPVTITYSPSSPGSHTATLRLQSNDRAAGKDLWVVTLSGSTESVQLRAQQQSRDLGDICLGDLVDLSLPWINVGTVPVHFVSAILLETSPSIRLIAATAPGESVASGGMLPVQVSLEAVALGDFSMRMAVAYGPCERADTILLSGSVVSTDLSLDRTLDLGELPVGIETRRVVTIRNRGSIDATVRTIGLAIPDPTVALEFPLLPQVVPAGGSMAIEVVIKPVVPAATSVNRLVVEGEGLCADSLAEPLLFQAIVADIVAERSSIEFDPLLPCLSTLESLDSLRLRNHASKEAMVTSVRLAADGASGFSIAGNVPTSIPPLGSSLIEIQFRAVASGYYHDTLLVETLVSDLPRLIRVPLSARSERLDLRTTNAAGEQIDRIIFGDISVCHSVRTDSVVLRNAGTIADTIMVSSDDARFVVTSAMPLVVLPDDSAVVHLRATGSGSAGDRSSLLRISAIPCTRESTLALSVSEIDLSARLGGLDYQTVNVGRAVDLSAELLNSGTSTRIIDRLLLEDPAAPFTLMEDFAGRSIAPGEILSLPVQYMPTVEGRSSVKLLAILRTPCPDTLSALLEGTGVESGVFIGRREIDFGSRFRCDAGCEQITIEGTGELPVTISGVRFEGLAGADALRISPGDFPLIVLPGESRTLSICFDSATVGTTLNAALFVETDDRAQPSIRIPLQARIIEPLLADSVVRFSTDPSSGGDTSITIVNASSVAITIDRLKLPPGFSILDPLPLQVPASGELVLRLSYRPEGGSTSGQGLLLLGYSLPCRDSLMMRLDAGSAGMLATGAPDLRGRWGERIAVPISLHNPGLLSSGPLDMEVVADRRLLHPLSVSSSPEWRAAGWNIDAAEFDAVRGAYRFTLVPSGAGATLLPDGDAVIIEYEVLRGDVIQTPIQPSLGSIGAGIVTESTAGSFILEDYCDAHGRLLQTGGAFRLTQNFPNPFSTISEVELEIPFAGDVLLTLHDLRGNEVARPVAEWLPAGTRRIRLEASTLPSGVYTYRLRAGLLLETRRMVIAR